MALGTETGRRTAETADRVHIPHVTALDGLRGAAIVGVLLFHGGHLVGGYLGVDLFFVLSGFLITTLLLAESGGSGSVRLGRFWARRARRLLPALAVTLLGVALYCVVFAQSDELGAIRSDALATIGYVANWRSIFAGSDYFALFRQPSPLNHTWSLAIEEQFYLIWPLIFVGLLAWWKAKAPRAVFATAIVLAVISSALMVVYFDAGNPSRSYFGTDTRASAVLMGAALAAAFTVYGHVKSRTSRVVLELAGAGGALVLAVLWARLAGDAARLYRGGFLVAGIAAVAVIAAAVHPRPGVIAKALSFTPLCWLGLISYGLYLWHWPIDVVFASHSGLTGWTLFATETAVALVIALVSYRYVEMPIRRGAGSARQWWIAIPVIAGTLIVAILVVTAGATSPPVASWSRRGAPGGVLLVGDSVAQSLSSGLIASGLDIGGGTTAGCRLIAGDLRFGGSICPWRAILRRGIAESKPKTVLLVIEPFEMFDVRPPGSDRFLSPGSAAWAKVYAGALEQAIALITAKGARVVIPSIPCMSAERGTSAADRLATGPLQVPRVRAANRVIAEVAARHPGKVVSPDLFGLLCPMGRYQESVGGVARVRYDGEHFTKAGATLVAKWLLPTLRASATP